MNMEDFVTGYPGIESGMRTAVTDMLGETVAQFFFDRLPNCFITEDDLRFIRSLGCNVVRIPFNYRHFETGDWPIEDEPEGSALLDTVILELHAATWWQNGGWHSDSSYQEAPFWGQRTFQDRAVR